MNVGASGRPIARISATLSRKSARVCPLSSFAEHRVVQRFDRAGDERAVRPFENRQQVAVLQQVRDLDRDVVTQPGPLLVERFHNRDRVARAR